MRDLDPDSVFPTFLKTQDSWFFTVLPQFPAWEGQWALLEGLKVDALGGLENALLGLLSACLLSHC